MNTTRFIASISISLAVASSAYAPPAFPGAEGAGAGALGGRGGDVYFVTTLADNNNPGSLRYGVNTAPAGGRTICFQVSGNIVLNSTLTINRNRITVAGQTAPGDGICLQNYSFNIAASDIIVRHLRSRLGTNALQEADCMWINSGANIVVDHFSASWSVDEVLSASRDVSNLTVQNCFITEALNNSIHVKGSHGYGGILSSDNWTTYSYLRNLYAHNRSRNPRVGSSQDQANPNTLRLDFRNNVIYNYGDRAGYTGGSPESCEVNYVGNYCIKGPSSTYNYILHGADSGTHVYQDGNYIDLNRNGLVDGSDTGWGMFGGTYTSFGSPFAVPAAPTESAPTTYERVVALSGAMPWRRDSADQRIAQTVQQQNGAIIDAVSDVGTWPTLLSETAPTDSDNDGIPDYWETALGWDPGVPNNNHLNADGYTDLEWYLNWLAAAHGECDYNGQVDLDLRQFVGGLANLTFGVANGTNGTVSLLGDGYTARFVAAVAYSGLADFSYTATNANNAAGFGPVTVGMLVNTNEALAGPTASFSNPTNGAALEGGVEITLAADVTEGDGVVTNVQFYAGTAEPLALVGEDATAPYSGPWTPPLIGGAHMLRVVALDDSGLSNTDTIAVTVNGTIVAPTASFSNPTHGAALEGGVEITLAADVTEGDGVVTNVQFYAGTAEPLTLVGEDATAPYSGPWTPPSTGGSYTLRVVAMDDNGLGDSDTIAVTVNRSIHVVSTFFGGGADMEFRENLSSSVFTESTSDGTAQNTRTSNGGDRNEVVGLKFDLRDYTLARLTNVTLNLTAYRLDTSTRAVNLYGVVQGTLSGTGTFDTETWNESASLYGDLPGLLTTDGDCATQNLNTGALTPLGSYSIVSSQPEGTVHTLSDPAITAFVQGYSGSGYVTFVLAANSTSTGQFRTATREATATATSVLTGAEGDFAPYLEFEVIGSVEAPVLEYVLTEGGTGIEFSWVGGFRLEYQTNSLEAGLGTIWMDYPDTNKPVTVPIDPDLPITLFRLAP